MRASSLPLLTRCVGSASIPQYDVRSDKNRDATEWGSLVHHWKEHGEIPPSRYRAALEKAIRLSGVDRDVLWPVGGVHETSMALRLSDAQVDTGELAERRQGATGWITGHSDFYYRMIDGELWIDDLKTSRLYPNPAPGYPGHMESLDVGDNRFPELPTSTQLRFYALATAEYLGHSGAVHCSITHWPRLPLTARHVPPARVWHRYSGVELREFLAELRTLEQHRVVNEKILAIGDPARYSGLVLNPGPQCRFCPSRVFCPVGLTDDQLNDRS